MRRGRLAQAVGVIVVVSLVIAALLKDLPVSETRSDLTSAVTATSNATDIPTLAEIPTTEFTNEKYVATNGDDTNPGTLVAPWRTIEFGMMSLLPGQTLFVRGGEYVEQIMSPPLRSGTPSSPIVVRPYDGERPVIRGLLWIEDADYWVFNGINVTWDEATGDSGQHMVKLTDGVGVSFINGELWGARSYAALLVASTGNGEPRDWTVAGNCIHDTYPSNGTNQDHLIYVNSGSTGSGGVVERNLLFNASNGEGIKIGGPSADSDGVAGVTLRYNTIVNTVQSILVAWGSHDNLIDHNLLVGIGNGHGNIRGYQLSGTGNVAENNAGGNLDLFVFNDDGYLGVEDMGNNLYPVDPDFSDANSCSGFRPMNQDVQGYGFLAPSG